MAFTHFLVNYMKTFEKSFLFYYLQIHLVPLAHTTATGTLNVDQPNVLTSAFASPVTVETEESVLVNIFVCNDRTCMKCSMPVCMFFCADRASENFRGIELRR